MALLLSSSRTSPSVLPRITVLKTTLRHATFIERPRRPYTFTQLVQLSDGSTYTMRTTSPLAMYRSQKDTRNVARWQPSDRSLRNVEVDEAGKLARFRMRYGRGYDAASSGDEKDASEETFEDGGEDEDEVFSDDDETDVSETPVNAEEKQAESAPDPVSERTKDSVEKKKKK